MARGHSINPVRQLTKEDIRTFLALWETETRQGIAEKLRITPQAVSSIANRIRQAGHRLPIKKRTGVLHLLIKEVIDEL